MPRIRSTHPRQWTDGDFVSCSPLARLLILAIRNEADDNGILKLSPVELKIRYLPVDNCDIEALFKEIEEHRQVRTYTVDGERFAIIRSFHKYQKPRHPTFYYPAPPASVLDPKSGFTTHPDFDSSTVTIPETYGNTSVIGVQRGEERERDEVIGEGEGKGDDSGNAATAAPPTLPSLDWVLDEYNATAKATGLPEAQRLTKKRKAAIRARIKEHGEDAVRQVVNAARSSRFLRGESGRETWKGATLDWLMKPDYFQNTLEGQYTDRSKINGNPVDNHTTSDDSGEWNLDCYRKADFLEHGDDPEWEAYADLTADLPPRSAPPFLEWKAEQARGGES